jgi:hypothetical protein
VIRSNGNRSNDPDKPGMWMILATFVFLVLIIIGVAVIAALTGG